MAVTRFSGPVLGAGLDFSIPIDEPGQTLLVGKGGHATIQAAVNAATSGSTIFVQPGSYTENVILNKDYLTLVGAQVGRYGWPDIVPATGVPVTVTGQGCKVARVRMAGTAADSCVQQGNGFTLEDCIFDGDGTAAKAGLRLLGVAASTSKTASEGFVKNSVFRGCANGIIFDTAAAPNGVGSTDNKIENCRFYSNTLDIATADSGVGLYSVKLTEVVGCSFEDKNKATYVDLTTANGGAASDQSGTVANCGFASDTITTTKIKAVGTGFTFMGNYDTVGIFDGSGLD